MVQSTLGLPTAARNPLLIPELFQCILDGFALPEQDLGTKPLSEAWREMQQALAALARTCRTLSEPSLDRLWRRLDSFEPLIRGSAPAETQIMLTRYSCRVQELILSDIDNLSLECVPTWPQTPFFPNLRVLRWSVHTEDDPCLAIIMDRLLSPSLVSLVAIVSRKHGIKSFMQNYISLCPRLKLKSVKFQISQHIAFSGKVSLPEIHQLSEAICMHRHLESLVLSIPIDDLALRPVMLSPQLKTVSVVLHPVESNLHDLTFTSADTPFCNVKNLELLVWDLQFVLSLLRQEAQAFHAFRLRSSDLQDVKAIFTLLTILASPRRLNSLQSISLTSCNLYALSNEHINISYDNAAHGLTYDTLYPLASFKHLRELEFRLFNEVSLKDEELTDLARSWPVLEVLQLNCSSAGRSASITLRGLLSLLKLCPCLRRLKLSLDAREVPQMTSAEVCNVVLDSLGLPNSPIRNAREVADFLSRHLPSVRNIEVYFQGTPSLPFEPPTEYSLLWAQVNKYLCVEGEE